MLKYTAMLVNWCKSSTIFISGLANNRKTFVNSSLTASKSMEASETEHLRRNLKVTERANVEIRDNLAIERTRFANERTFLAYIRTAMGLVLAGFSLMQFFHDKIFVWVGVVFIPLGIFVSIIGLKKYLVKRQFILQHRANYTPTSALFAKMAAKEKRKLDNRSEE